MSPGQPSQGWDLKESTVPMLELSAIVEACGGELARGAADGTVSSYSIDTRRLKAGGLFFALQGERTDGHDFLTAAARVPAAAAIVNHVPETREALPERLIVVPDVIHAMADLAKLARRSLHDATWIALTGSSGKTTTKELIAAACSVSTRVHRTPGNLNNHLGVPLTLLATPEDSQSVVVEMGMSASLEIAYLTDIVDPDIALITNIQPAHLAFFASIDAIAAAKGELFALLRNDAIAVVNLDDPLVRVQACRHNGPQVTFGFHENADIRMLEIEDRFQPGVAFRFAASGRERRVELALGGAHAARNALAALAVAAAAGTDLDDAVEAMHKVHAASGRGRVHELDREITLIDDSYNCSPAALDSVLTTFSASRPSGRRVLVLGDMLELGSQERELHATAGRHAAEAGVQSMITVGTRAAWAAGSAEEAGVHISARFRNAKLAAKEIGNHLNTGDLVLIKGSRGAGLDRIVDRLVEKFGGGA
jgi:UDP-N-acetylmuramoyl-tripeptide--D-alanyl-D-alanine ligase